MHAFIFRWTPEGRRFALLTRQFWQIRSDPTCGWRAARDNRLAGAILLQVSEAVGAQSSPHDSVR
jgi:hypothetical protein